MLTMIPGSIRNTSFDRMTREMDRLLERFMNPAPQAHPGDAAPSASWPGLNVWRDADEIVAEAEIPGFRMDDLELFATEDTLTIRGQRTARAPENATPLRTERTVQRFERSLRLPTAIEPDAVKATLADGVLRVTLPVAEAARPRRIQIDGPARAQQQNALPQGAKSHPSQTQS